MPRLVLIHQVRTNQNHRKLTWRKSRLPCWSGSAVRDTSALTAGKVMLDMAATAPAAHIILGGGDAKLKTPFTQPLPPPLITGSSECSTLLTMAQTQTRTRRAAGSGSPGPVRSYSYFQWTSSANLVPPSSHRESPSLSPELTNEKQCLVLKVNVTRKEMSYEPDKTPSYNLTQLRRPDRTYRQTDRRLPVR